MCGRVLNGNDYRLRIRSNLVNLLFRYYLGWHAVTWRLNQESVVHFLFLGVTCLGCVVIYLTHRNQCWLTTPWSARPWRFVGYGLLIVALLLGGSVLKTSAAIFAWIAIVLFVFGVLPFLPLLSGYSNRDY